MTAGARRGRTRQLILRMLGTGLALAVVVVVYLLVLTRGAIL